MAVAHNSSKEQVVLRAWYPRRRLALRAAATSSSSRAALGAWDRGRADPGPWGACRGHPCSSGPLACSTGHRCVVWGGRAVFEMLLLPLLCGTSVRVLVSGWRSYALTLLLPIGSPQASHCNMRIRHHLQDRPQRQPQSPRQDSVCPVCCQPRAAEMGVALPCLRVEPSLDLFAPVPLSISFLLHLVLPMAVLSLTFGDSFMGISYIPWLCLLLRLRITKQV